MKQLWVINGPNLNTLGSRDSNIYGSHTLADIETMLTEKASTYNLSISFFQSNSEGDLITKVQSIRSSINGLIINPGGLTHTSISLHDALELLECPIIEVHLSHIYQRESFRHHSVTAAACSGQISGLGYHGYLMALEYIASTI